MEKMICRFCQREFEPVELSGVRRLPAHKEAAGSIFACEGSDAKLEDAVAGYVAPAQPVTQISGKIKKPVKLDPKLANSKVKNFYEKDVDPEWEKKIGF